MSKIHLKSYCRGCKNLKFVTDKLYADNKVVDSITYCENCKLCEQIHNHMKNAKKNEDVTPMVTREEIQLREYEQLGREIRIWHDDGVRPEFPVVSSRMAIDNLKKRFTDLKNENVILRMGLVVFGGLILGNVLAVLL